jgi:hypothetical protein
MGSISHCKCNGVVKIQDSFVLDVSDFGAIVEVVLAIPALLSDGSGVPFSGGWDYLYLNPYSRDVCHIPEINE